MLLHELSKSLKNTKKGALFVIFFQRNIYFSLIESSNGEMKMLPYKE